MPEGRNLKLRHCDKGQGYSWSVCYRMLILSPKSKATWLSAKILITIRTLSTDIAILIWIFDPWKKYGSQQYVFLG